MRTVVQTEIPEQASVEKWEGAQAGKGWIGDHAMGVKANFESGDENI